MDGIRAAHAKSPSRDHLKMEVLDLTIAVPGYPRLDPATRESLMAGEAFSPLPHSLQMQLFGHMGSVNWLTAQVQSSAVLVAEDWVVSIHGKKLSHNVSALAVVLNSIGQELNAPVSITFPTLQNGDGEALHVSLRRQFRRDRIAGGIKWVMTIVLSALAGGFIRWLFFGGGLP